MYMCWYLGVCTKAILQLLFTSTTHCQILQHTAKHCNILQHIATYCNTLQHTATHCNTLQHTVTHCNTLQHTATYCNTTHSYMYTFTRDTLGEQRVCGTSILFDLFDLHWLKTGGERKREKEKEREREGERESERERGRDRERERDRMSSFYSTLCLYVYRYIRVCGDLLLFDFQWLEKEGERKGERVRERRRGKREREKGTQSVCLRVCQRENKSTRRVGKAWVRGFRQICIWIIT